MIVTRADGSQAQIPPERCRATVDGGECGCGQFAPGWGRCTNRDCGEMCLRWTCKERGHVTVDIEHQCRELHPDRQRWPCESEGLIRRPN